MYLDLHSHSVSSDDSRATVEQYVKWVQLLRKKGYTVDGIVLTEHRKFDFDKDYSQLAAEYNLLVLKGSELDTRYGHFLVYGVTEALAKEVNLADVRLDARELMQAARRHQAIAIPAHPGRFGIGLVDYMEQGESFADVQIVERLNGGSRPGRTSGPTNCASSKTTEAPAAATPHLTSQIAACLTSFPTRIQNEQDLVEALLTGDFTPVWLEDTRQG